MHGGAPTENPESLFATAGTRRRYGELYAELLKPGTDGPIFKTAYYQLDDLRYVTVSGPEKDDPTSPSIGNTTLWEVSADGKTVTTTTYDNLTESSVIPVEIRKEAVKVGELPDIHLNELLPEVPESEMVNIPEEELTQVPYEGHSDDDPKADLRKFADVTETRGE